MNCCPIVTSKCSRISSDTYKSFDKYCNHTISHTHGAIDLYYDSIEDLEMMDCFLDFQEIAVPPSKT